MSRTAYEIVYPVRHGDGRLKPFPTIYWLVDPQLDRRLADLERRGVIAQLHRQINAEERLRHRLHADHRRYAQARWRLLNPEDQAQIEGSGLESALKDRGVGGVANFDSIKCLHAHYAHHLADHNLVGQLLDQCYAPAEATRAGFTPPLAEGEVYA